MSATERRHAENPHSAAVSHHQLKPSLHLSIIVVVVITVLLLPLRTEVDVTVMVECA